MPAELATSESLLPPLDYASAPARAPRSGPELKLIAAPAPPETTLADSPLPAATEAPVADGVPAAPETVPAPSRLAALRSLTEEEIVALFS